MNDEKDGLYGSHRQVWKILTQTKKKKKRREKHQAGDGVEDGLCRDLGTIKEFVINGELGGDGVVGGPFLLDLTVDMRTITLINNNKPVEKHMKTADVDNGETRAAAIEPALNLVSIKARTSPFAFLLPSTLKFYIMVVR